MRSQAVLEAFPQAAVMVAPSTGCTCIELDGLDLAFAERELFESAVAMGRAALKASGDSERTRSSASSANTGSRDCERLERQGATGDIRAGWETCVRARPATARRGNPDALLALGRAPPDASPAPRRWHRRHPCARRRRFSHGYALPRRTVGARQRAAPGRLWRRRCEAAPSCRGAMCARREFRRAHRARR